VRQSSVTLSYAETLDRPRGVATVRYDARVRYREDRSVRQWVPAVMEDRYEWRLRSLETGQPARELIMDGRSVYAGYRRFETGGRLIR
jgi:hypothetical protein